jgi:NADPH:quinone reductase-like Zn-dependent oxidoreductase
MEKARVLECWEPGQQPALRISDRDVPAPSGSQVLVEIEASSVNPIDAKRASGYGRRLLALKGAGRFPMVLGNDIAGVVRAVGPKAGPWKPGQRVYGVVPTGQGGAHASVAIADARWLRRAPDGCPAQALAALPYSFTTMALALRAVGLDPSTAKGRRVLINGAAGALGRLALQTLVPWGAQVTAVCSTSDEQTCLDLGAEEVLDRRRRSVTALAAHFDASLNFGSWSDDALMLQRLKPDAMGHATAVHPLLDNFDRLGWIGGLRATLRDLSQQRRLLKQRSPRARYHWVTFKPDGAALDALHSQLPAISLPVGTAVPFEQAAAAFAHVHERRAGRALLLPGAR